MAPLQLSPHIEGIVLPPHTFGQHDRVGSRLTNRYARLGCQHAVPGLASGHLP